MRCKKINCFKWIVLALLILLGIGVGCYYYIFLRKSVHLTYVYIKAPSLIPVEKLNKTNAKAIGKLTIYFTKDLSSFSDRWTKQVSVAPLRLVDKTVKHGVQLFPHVPGQWRWVSDSELVFVPKEPWPAGQTYTIQLHHDLLTKDIRLPQYHYQFHTTPLSVHITKAIFDINLKSPNKNQIAATVETNYPVSNTVLSHHIKFFYVPSFPLASLSIPYQLKSGPYHRRFYLIAPVIVKDQVQFVVLGIQKGFVAQSKGQPIIDGIRKEIKIPAINHYLKINSVKLKSKLDAHGITHQVLSVHTNIGIGDHSLRKHLTLYLLNKDDSDTVSRHYMDTPNMVTDAMLKKAKQLLVDPLPTEHHYAQSHHIIINAPPEQVLLIQITKGLTGNGGFYLMSTDRRLLRTRHLPVRIQLMHHGEISALSGQQKIGFITQGIRDLRVQVHHVLPSQLNRLIDQTYGQLGDLHFNNYHVDEGSISENFRMVKHFSHVPLNKPHYDYLDFTALSKPFHSKFGVYIIELQAWGKHRNRVFGPKLRHLLLLTNLGLYLKKNDRSSVQDLFVQSIVSGKPVASAQVSLLGVNGLPLASGLTDQDGHWHSMVDSYRYDRPESQRPLVFVVKKGDDLAFIPFDRASRQLRFNRFDVSGRFYKASSSRLTGFTFTSQDLYRPGSAVYFGHILKNNQWWLDSDITSQARMVGMPIHCEISGPQGKILLESTLHLNAVGFIDQQWVIPRDAKSGQYTVHLSIKDHAGVGGYRISSGTFRVADFTPETLKLVTTFNKVSHRGWVLPNDLKALVQLKHLYGLPAIGNQVRAEVTLTPGAIYLPFYSNYQFRDPLLSKQDDLKTIRIHLSKQTTDALGQTIFTLNDSRYTQSTYHLNLYIEAFNQGGGHAVESVNELSVSPLSYLVGVDTRGSLVGLREHKKRSVKWIAVNSKGKTIALDHLRLKTYRMKSISILAQRADGTYHYENRKKPILLNEKPFKISQLGSESELSTNDIGAYMMTLTHEHQTVVGKIYFNVIGVHNILAQQSRLTLNLNQSVYQPGDNIHMLIHTPYPGTGLITIESNRVVAFKWFQTNRTSSKQTIAIPKDFRGNGYVQVDFARAFDSTETFMNPLSYAVAPFSMNHDKRKIKINLHVPKKQLPGTSLEVKYQLNQPGKLIIYAVNSGILQLAHYHLPDPLGYFFEKKALQVSTLQTLDMLLPKYQELALSHPPGGAMTPEALLQHVINPFKGHHQKPLVFWSKLLKASLKQGKLSIPIPSSFNGELKVMAVAVNATGIGAAETDTHIQAHFIMTPNAPTFVAPKDRFQLAVNVTNNLTEKEKNHPITVLIKKNAFFDIVGKSQHQIRLKKKAQTTVYFNVKARQHLGTVQFHVFADNGVLNSKIDWPISIRSPMIYRRYVRSGFSKRTAHLPIQETFYPEHRQLLISASTDPSILIPGLLEKLKHYHQAMPNLYAVFGNEKQYFDEGDLNKKASVITLLSECQHTNGQFILPDHFDFIESDKLSLAIMDLLMEARSHHQFVPHAIYQLGLHYIQRIVENIDSDDLTDQAKAIFIVTRSGIVTSNALNQLVYQLQKRYAKHTFGNLAALYAAASYKILLQNKVADIILQGYKKHPPELSAEALRLLSTYFPLAVKKLVTPNALMKIINPISPLTVDQILDSIVGLKAYAVLLKQDAQARIVITGENAKHEKKLLQKGERIQQSPVPSDMTALYLQPQADKIFYYQLLLLGYPDTLPKDAIKEGLDVYSEITDNKGDPIHTVRLGDQIRLVIRLRKTTSRKNIPVSLVHLLPSGFSPLKNNADYSQHKQINRDDRVLWYLSASDKTKTIIYPLRATTRGYFVIPPVYVQSVVDPDHIFAQGVANQIQVK